MSFNDKVKRFFTTDRIDNETLKLMEHCDTLPHNSQGEAEKQQIMEALAQRGYVLIENIDGSFSWQSKATGRNVRHYLGWIRHYAKE
ncbi:hypothetical protein ccbrp13_56310 [Ktedonobacteria bacterium brp13]|nr:hypothetical protein ccbrp13_56310 [Ktedonobacteria bacterium brp13]